jgi:CelD/BcsL family acetyltransferase involved in cellulose biosynthesis
MSVSRRTWKFREGAGMAGSLQLIKYYHSLLGMLNKNGWLRVNILKHKGEPVAFVFNSRYKKTVYGHQLGYDDNYKAFSPGRYILSRSIKETFGAGVAEYDFLGKDESYKMSFTSTCRGHAKYFIFNGTLMGGVLNAVENIFLPVVKGFAGRVVPSLRGEAVK